MNTAKGCITILTDNYVFGRTEALAEHGISIFLETDKGNFLFDTGRGMTIVHNAGLLHKDLTKINKIVLSHAHLDHTGGLPAVLRILPQEQTDVYAHPDIFAYRYREINGNKRYGGIPFTRGHLEQMGANFILAKDYVEIEKGISVTGEIPRITTFEGGDFQGRWIVRDDGEIPDIIPDDLSIVITTKRGLVLVLGCAHAGIVNIINYVIEKSGIDKFFAIIGGTHIGFSGETQLQESIQALKKYNIDHFIPSHCSGLEAITKMKETFGEMLRFSHVGFRLDF